MTIEQSGSVKTSISIDDLIRDSESFLKKLKLYKKSQKTVIRGFTIVEANGYYRGIRSVNSKTYSIHLGKKFDSDAAYKKISDALEKMPDQIRKECGK